MPTPINETIRYRLPWSASSTVNSLTTTTASSAAPASQTPREARRLPRSMAVTPMIDQVIDKAAWVSCEANKAEKSQGTPAQ